eukprot:4589772-Pleurochrysis_carterae.AAC.1
MRWHDEADFRGGGRAVRMCAKWSDRTGFARMVSSSRVSVSKHERSWTTPPARPSVALAQSFSRFFAGAGTPRKGGTACPRRGCFRRRVA